MHTYIQQLAKQFQDLADSKRAIGAKAYMKNKFEFYGIPMALRKTVCKQYFKKHPLSTIEELSEIAQALWEPDQREFQYAAIELMALHAKLWTEDIVTLFKYCIINKSWWDTVDFISGYCNAKYFQLFPTQIKPVTGRWNNSDNIWLQRCSLLFQKGYKQDLDTSLLSQYILHLSSSKEFFVQKAIGWVLREYARTNAEWVKAFVSNNALPPLSKREALKHLK